MQSLVEQYIWLRVTDKLDRKKMSGLSSRAPNTAHIHPLIIYTSIICHEATELTLVTYTHTQVTFKTEHFYISLALQSVIAADHNAVVKLYLLYNYPYTNQLMIATSIKMIITGSACLTLNIVDKQTAEHRAVTVQPYLIVPCGVEP